MPDILPRRRLLAASAAALPALLATAGCRSSDAFAGPDPLAGRPTPAPDVIALQEVIAAEQAMIALYRAAVTSGLRPATAVRATLAQHRQHLAQLQTRLVIPPGAPASASASASASSSASASASASAGRVSLARLRTAENASASDLVQRLVTMPPALAQLFASIAASDATHVVALGG